jgi:hypothetical protein
VATALALVFIDFDYFVALASNPKSYLAYQVQLG